MRVFSLSNSQKDRERPPPSTAPIMTKSWCVSAWVAVALSAVLGTHTNVSASASAPSKDPELASSSNTVIIASSINTTRHCLGVLIAPSFVLAASECLQYEFQMLTKSTAKTLQVHAQSEQTAGIAHYIVPMSSLATAVSFALLRLREPIHDHPVALLEGMPNSRDADEVLVMSALEGSHELVSATPTKRAPLTTCKTQFASILTNTKEAEDQWMCVDTLKDCQGVVELPTTKKWIHHGFLFEQPGTLYGVSWTYATRCDGVTSTTPVQTVASIREVIDYYVTEHTWRRQWVMTSPTPPQVAPPTMSPPDSSPPKNDTSPSHHSEDGSQNPDTDWSNDKDGDGDQDQLVPVPSWLFHVGSAGAYLTRTTDADTNNGALAYFITPSHLVLPRIWHHGDIQEFKWATTSSGNQYPVKSVQAESDFHADKLEKTDTNMQRELPTALYVVELEIPADEAYVQLVLVPPPKVGVEYAQTRIQTFDSVVGPHRRHYQSTEDPSSSSSDEDQLVDSADANTDIIFTLSEIQFQNITSCIALPEQIPSANELLCAHANDTNSDRPTPSAVGVFTQSDSFVGFTVETDVDANKFVVIPLATPTRRTFLDAATNNRIQWEETDRFSEDADQIALYPSYIVKLYTLESTLFPACDGLLVAPAYVITTASCVKEFGPISSAGLRQRNQDEQQYQVLNDYQVAHPLYNSSADYLYDVAVVKLAEPVLDINPIVLNPGYPAWIQNVTIHRPVFSIMGDRGLLAPSGEVLTSCEQPQKNTTATDDDDQPLVRARGICVAPPEGNNRERMWVSEGDPLISQTQFGAITAVGLAVRVPIEDEPLAGEDEPSVGDDGSIGFEQASNGIFETGEYVPPAQVYLSFADNANFINAYVEGVVWGKQPTLLTTTATPSPPNCVVGLRITRDGLNFCSGVLIGSAYVLTAAHCVGDRLVNFVAVGVGEQEEVLPVLRGNVILHPSYGNPHRFSYDAAVIELAIGATAKGIVLDTAPDYSSQMRATMYGFGVVAGAPPHQPPRFHSIEMPLYSRAQCAARLPDIEESMLCAGGEKDKDACQGDSGGPLVLRAAGQELLVGIVSAGYGCGIEGVPGLYARASSLRRFVESCVVGSRWGSSSDANANASGRSPTPTVTPTPGSNETRDNGVDPGDIESYSRGPSPNNTAGTGDVDDSFTQPIKSITLPSDAQPRLRVALMAFLMSDYESFLDDLNNLLWRIVDPNNEIIFYSRGELRVLEEIFKTRIASLLYNRKDRFQRGWSVASILDSASVSMAAGACDGH